MKNLFTAVILGIALAGVTLAQPSSKVKVLAAASTENSLAYAEFMARNGQALHTLIKEHGVQLRSFPDGVLQAVGKAIAEVMGKAGDADPLTKKVYDSYVAFRREVAEWTALSEQGYANARSSFFS